ncbi:MAG: hypothetical protein KDJ52_00290 [Anaerolineae bacterium]|nr:hypothetical protein [Anaerolineae bacterium]
MDKELRQEIREALTVFRTGVQFVVTLFGFSIGTSLGVMAVTLASVSWTRIGLNLGIILGLGLVAAAGASYGLFRLELRQTEHLQEQDREHRADHANNATDQRIF